MLGISGTELLIILFFGFLIFGPEKLPQMGRTVGRAIRQFRDASEAANKKFREEVADPFQEAMAPYKGTVEDSMRPIQEDLDAINDTLNQTKSMISDPFKDMFKTPVAESKAAAGVVLDGELAADSALASEAALGDDPFAEVFEEETVVVEREAKPIPETKGAVKKGVAASLYDLDEEEGGE